MAKCKEYANHEEWKRDMERILGFPKDCLSREWTAKELIFKPLFPNWDLDTTWTK